MIELDFAISDEWNVNLSPQDLRNACEMDLRYRVACGDLVLFVNGVDFSACWGWLRRKRIGRL